MFHHSLESGSALSQLPLTPSHLNYHKNAKRKSKERYGREREREEREGHGEN
jgi:hypothetical protein